MPIDVAVSEKVKELVAQVLQLEPHEVTDESFFGVDLGGESIDLLELGFLCEKHFRVRVKFQDLTSHELTVAADGTLTPESLEQLQQRFPLLETSHWHGRRFNRPLELLAVGDIAAIVASELRQTVAKAG